MTFQNAPFHHCVPISIPDFCVIWNWLYLYIVIKTIVLFQTIIKMGNQFQRSVKFFSQEAFINYYHGCCEADLSFSLLYSEGFKKTFLKIIDDQSFRLRAVFHFALNLNFAFSCWCTEILSSCVIQYLIVLCLGWLENVQSCVPVVKYIPQSLMFN